MSLENVIARHDLRRAGAPPARAKGVVLLIHGRGASAESILPLADAKARRAARIKRIIDKPAFPAQHLGNGLLEQRIGIIGVMIHV